MWVTVGMGKGGRESGVQWCLISSTLIKSLLGSITALLNGLETRNGGEETSNSYFLKDDDSQELSLGDFD